MGTFGDSSAGVGVGVPSTENPHKRGCRAGRVMQSAYRFSKFAFVREFTLAAALSHSVREGAVAAPSAVFSPKTVEALATTACRLKASLVSFQNKAVGVILTIWKLSESSCTTSICYRTFNTGNGTLASPVRAEHVLVSRGRRTAESCLLVKLLFNRVGGTANGTGTGDQYCVMF